MTIDEAFQRIIRGHWMLILLCVLATTIAVAIALRAQPPEYQAVSRIQLDDGLASSNVQADAASTRVAGIATSRSAVDKALKAGHSDADPVTFAANNVSVRRVGVSPIVEIGVTDRDPVDAAAMAKAITTEVIAFLNDARGSGVKEQTASLDASIRALNQQRDALVPQLITARPGQVLRLQAELTGLDSVLADQMRQRSDLLVAAAAQPTALLLDQASVPTTPTTDKPGQKVALAGLLGLLLGICLAAALETVRPRLRRPQAVADALGLPLLGALSKADLAAGRSWRPLVHSSQPPGLRTESTVPVVPVLGGSQRRTGLPTARAQGPLLQMPQLRTALNPVADRMALIARHLDAERGLLLSVRSADEDLVHHLAEGLRDRADPERAHRLDCVALDGHWYDPGDGPVAVIVCPTPVLKKELKPTQELIAAAGWPCLGVLTYPGRRRSARMFQAATRPSGVRS